MIHRTARKTTGFTLVELMIVIGIAAMLLAIVITATQSLRRGNKVAQCRFKLQQISNAMKAYHFDWGSVPPRYPGYPGPLVTVPPYPDAETWGRGLVALWEGGYLSSRRALHCPTDEDYPDPNDLAYYLGYMDQDPDAAALYGFDNYKYLSTRGIDPADPYFKRQLEHPEFYLGASAATWYPDDETVVAWCNFHTRDYFRDGEPQYQVLFWDGSIKTLPAWLFDGPQPEDPVPGLAPDAAWKVTPDILE